MKGVGYLISTVSVVLLAIVAWQSTIQNPDLKPYLIGGVLTSILGMFVRYLAHEKDKRERERLAAAGVVESGSVAARPEAAARPQLVRTAKLPS
ncbi:MAG TPA: hypothetical protein VGW34_14090 [Allosphingosinicella sp.]|nr:hypothetical protein [Allosphingosinicella sp.]